MTTPKFEPRLLGEDEPVDIRRAISLTQPAPPAPGELQLTDDFWPLLTQQGRYKVNYGGRCRGSAKSMSIARALLWLAVRVKIRVLCTHEIQHTIAQSVDAGLRAAIDEMGYFSYFSITNNAIRSSIGSEFIFMGLRADPIEIKSLHGINIVWVEEAQAVSERSWDILTKTMTSTRSRKSLSRERSTNVRVTR